MRCLKCSRGRSRSRTNCLALVWFQEKLRPHLFGWQFTVFKDKNSFRWLASKRNVKGKYGHWTPRVRVRAPTCKSNLLCCGWCPHRYPVFTPEVTDLVARTGFCLIGNCHPLDKLKIFQIADPSVRKTINDMETNGARYPYRSPWRGSPFLLTRVSEQLRGYNKNREVTWRAALLVGMYCMRATMRNVEVIWVSRKKWEIETKSLVGRIGK